MCRSAAAVLAVLTALLCAMQQCAAARRNQPLNYRPIIGVLAQENIPDDQYAHGVSYIAASYVKFLEGAGARVVPVRINRTEEEYAHIFNAINGRAAKIFYDLALKANDAGDYFPIWGTCQGFQQLSVLTANKNLLTITDTKAVALPLTLTPAQSSRLFRSFPKDLLQSLAVENITGNFHKWSLSLQNYSRNAKLKRFYKVLSTNNDGKKEFISTMEAQRYPFYALLISEAMKNQHHFPSLVEEERALIYNFSPVFRGMNSIFIQNYYFD
ncbi:hypothetical protein KUCAC02_030585 [Chaenocephalus aceratus]|uniref:Uncharacterized protein n=1 Tax=Chaenocephalus aceratus TaxID=36190 RepID=A0ACB9XJA7_CHAAC|nr:hypothetical protein KUCAC02_030585 [Chaenocephalus aceratus]